ncbi:MAG TPA: RNA polymerase sigma-54 factor [Prevotellaceae bacterium]|nr:RNA polymerase sigma-54 factor [Prevotellaceae bacterium]
MEQKNVLGQQQSQQQVQVQTQVPQQVLLARLMEMPVDALRQRVDNECMENPWLEKSREDSDDPASVAGNGDGGDIQPDGDGTAADERVGDYGSEDDMPDHLLGNPAGAGRPENMDYRSTLSFYDHLKDQAHEYDLTPHQEQVLEYLVGSLGEDGLLPKSLDQLADEAEIYQGITTDSHELETMLHVLWQFDPPGIGARSLQECLLLQVARLPHVRFRKETTQVLRSCFDDFMHKRWDRIARTLHLDERTVEGVKREILRLDPHPGFSLGERDGAAGQHVTPDFLVDTDTDGNITMTLNEGDMPSLTISDDATGRLASYERRGTGRLSRSELEDMRFTRRYVERGQMFIQALLQRRETMMRTMQAIISWQRPFFLTGDESQLRPMVLEDIAGRTGYDISTISRVSNSKYVQTSFGIYPLRWFFQRKSVGTDSGAQVTQRAVKAKLRELVEGEDKASPLSDERLTELMAGAGYPIARRTVAKYRDMMGIPPARMRR